MNVMNAPTACWGSMQWSWQKVAVVKAVLQLLLLVITIVKVDSETILNSEATCESEQMDNSVWMPFMSVRERRACLLIPKTNAPLKDGFLRLDSLRFEDADRSFLRKHITNELTKKSSRSPEALMKDLVFLQDMFALRKNEVQKFWDDPGPSLWLDCVYVMDTCSWDFIFARLNNSGITLFESAFIDYEEPQAFLNAPGTLCMAVSRTILHTDLFRQRRPRVLIFDESQVKDVDIQMIAQGLPAMGKTVVLGKPTSAVQSMFEVHGFHVVEQDNFFVAVLKPHVVESDNPAAAQNYIGKVANVYVANMDEDYGTRWPEACENFRTAGLDGLWPKHERFRAINGHKELAITVELRHLFRTNGLRVLNPFPKHDFRPGVLGCSATHILLWSKLAKRTDLRDLDSIIILEDDFYFTEDMASKWKRGPGHSLSMSDPRWDIIMLGFNNDAMFTPGIPVWDGVEAFPSIGRSLGYGTHGYMLRKRGAKRLLRLLHTFGMPQGVDNFLIEAWAQKYIVAYKSVPWLIYAKSTDAGYGSKTDEEYDRSSADYCLQYDEEETELLQSKEDLFPSHGPATANLVLHPDNLPVATQIMLNPNLHPDMRLKLGAEIIPSFTQNDLFKLHPCAQFCLQYGHNNFSYPSPQCHYIFDTYITSVYTDPKRLKFGQETEIYAAILSANGKIWQNSISEPLIVNASATVAQMILYEVQPNQLELEVEILRAPANFMSKHSSSLLCVNEYCDPLASFPLSFNISVTSNEGVAVRATLQTLGSRRDLAIPIEHFYRTGSGRANSIHVRALLRGL